MLLGPKAKTRRGPTVQVDYLIYLQEIKPWPPSQSLKSIRSVLIQWENGDKNSGSTSSVVPCLTDGKIEFNESFRLSLTLLKDMSVKNGDVENFHKNLLEFNLYEPRRDQTVKGQLLGTAIVDLADYGILREATSITVPVNCTRSFRNTTQSVLHFRIQPIDKARSSLSSRSSLQKETSLEKNGTGGGESVSSLMNEEYTEDAEFNSLTDDDVSSSHSSLANSTAESSGSFASPNGEDEATAKDHDRALKENHGKSKLGLEKSEREQSQGDQKIGSRHNSEFKMPHICSAEPAYVMVNGTDPESVYSGNDNEPRADDGDGQSRETVNTYEDNYNGQAGEGLHVLEEREYSLEDGTSDRCSSGSDSAFSKHRSRNINSVRSTVDSSRSNGSAGASFAGMERKKAKVHPSERKNISSESRTIELEQRLKMLEEELREAAAAEVSLYAVAAEHGSSISKVHAPARRLSRLYLQSGKKYYQGRRTSAARSAVSGLIVVAKACGNDVSRLTFWLSNSVVLRAIIRQAFREKPSSVSDGPLNGIHETAEKRPPSLTWKASSPYKKDIKTSEQVENWEDPRTFISALEKVETWIFSRIVESVWWQILTPHMQSTAAKVVSKPVDSGSKKFFRRQSTSSDQDQVTLSLELWKKSFKDACERLCPVRAAGHECGCLPVLYKLIMEQCVARLDVAMFNALLREPGDDIPTDPVSDPISDARVLPIRAGKSSFGAGAQLKNAIGNWSRLLSDLFGMDEDDDDDDPLDDEEAHNIDSNGNDERSKPYSSFKSFHLLKSLSDLMMLPKDMLLNSSIRKEVCPAFSAQLIVRILDNFVPDEFCPDRIPDAVMETLESVDVEDEGEGIITNLPCSAPAVMYMPPSALSIANIFADPAGNQSSQLRRSSSVLRKSNTSDDELDELESPLDKIIVSNLQPSPTQARASGKSMAMNGHEIARRYQLLREVWKNSN